MRDTVKPVSYAARATDERVTYLRIYADAEGETQHGGDGGGVHAAGHGHGDETTLRPRAQGQNIGLDKGAHGRGTILAGFDGFAIGG